MDCMDNMDKLTFSSPLCPLSPQNAGLRQKCAVKKTPPAVSKQSVLQFENLSGCRNFQARNQYEFLSQTDDEAFIFSFSHHMSEANASYLER